MNIQENLQTFVNHFFEGNASKLIAAFLILIIGWFVALLIKGGVTRALKRTNWDEKLLASDSNQDANKVFGKMAYYIVMLYVLMLVLDTLGLSQALEPLNNMVSNFMAALPKIVYASVVGYVGYLLAKVVSSLINISGGALDNWVEKTGFENTDQIVNILQKVVFLVIFIPMLVQAFAILDMDAISVPASQLLGNFTNMIGDVLLAAIVLFLFVWGGRFIANFLTDLFKGLGFDNHAEKLGLSQILGNASISKIASNIIYFFIVFFGVITATDILDLNDLSEIFNNLVNLTGQILFGLVILVIGNFISKVIYDALMRGEGNQFVANVVRYASLALFLAIGLRQMGIANEIIDLAFGLTLGAVAVVIALSYGLGGREAAGKHFQKILDKFDNK